MYRPAKFTGDAVMVPQLLFQKLAVPGAQEPWFRVALYVLSVGGAEAGQIAAALGLPKAKVESALTFWEGAGLLVREAPAETENPPPPKRGRMTTGQTVEAGRADPRLGAMLGELQRVFGRVVGQSEINHFVTLYVQDGYPADLILTAASYSAGRGVTRASYVESVLEGWRKAGIKDCRAADEHLRLLARREEREKALAGAMGLEWDPFTLADKRKIAAWFEDYGYDTEMIEAARLAAGEHKNEVKYLAGILKKWYAKGYATAGDVRASDEGRNLRVQGSRPGIAPEEDVMLRAAGYVPLKRRDEG